MTKTQQQQQQQQQIERNLKQNTFKSHLFTD